jgi:hypothetical protein
MKALATQLNPFHGAINSLTAFDFRNYPTFEYVSKFIHKDKRGWSARVAFKNGDAVGIFCRGFDVTINGGHFIGGNINRAVAEAVGHPTDLTKHSFTEAQLAELGWVKPPVLEPSAIEQWHMNGDMDAPMPE